MPEATINETWKPIKGYEKRYSVSNRGRVRSDAVSQYVRTGYILKGFINWLGYHFVTLHNDHRKKNHFSVHSLVAAAFIGPRPPGKEINHINNNRSDNHASNLEYVTHKENIRHAMEFGTFNNTGSNSSVTHLTEAKVIAMRKRYTTGKYAKAFLARQYGISATTACRIINRRTWKHC